MAVFIGSALLTRLVAAKSGVSLSDVEKVLAVVNSVTLDLLRSGAKVRTLNGYVVVIDKKATRRTKPGTSELVDVPAKKMIVYKETRVR